MLWDNFMLQKKKHYMKIKQKLRYPLFLLISVFICWNKECSNFNLHLKTHSGNIQQKEETLSANHLKY